MNGQVHKIQRQEIHLNMSDDREAFALQEKVSNHFQTHLLPEMEKLFDQLVSPEKLLSIDRLEVDLGHFSEGNLTSQEFLFQLLEKLRAAIEQMQQGEDSTSQWMSLSESTFQQWMNFLKSGNLGWQNYQLHEDWENQVLEVLSSDIGILGNFLKQLGEKPLILQRLVWQHSFSFQLKLLTVLQPELTSWIKPLFEEIKKWDSRSNEFIGKPEKEQQAQFEQEQPKDSTLQLIQFIQIIAQGLSTSAYHESGDQLIQRFFFVAFQWVSDGSKKGSISFENFSEKLAPSLVPWLADGLMATEGTVLEKEFPMILRSLKGSFLRKSTTSKDFPKEDQSDKKGRAPIEWKEEKGAFENEKLQEESTSTKNKKTRDLGEKGEDATEKNKTIEGENIEGKTQESISEQSLDGEIQGLVQPQEEFQTQPLIPEISTWEEKHPQQETGTYYIAHAGIILTHSYLLSFFRYLELIKGVSFVSDHLRFKALHLIHYLACGQHPAPEYSLLLPKLLCGVPLNMPVPLLVDIEESMLEEGENLLEAIIDNWGTLGNASPDGLREGFLQRPGKLSKNEQGWLLQVESQTIDVLLDKLPWTIGMIKTPWMKEMLRVDWR